MKARRIGWLVWLLAAAGLYFFENNTGTRAVLVSSALLPALSLLCAAMTARRVVLSLDAPQALKQGERGEAVCRAVGAPTAGCSLACRVEWVNPLTGGTGGQALRVSGGFARFAVPGGHCGCVRVSLVEAEARDWFGLGRFSCAAGAACAVMIVPALHPAGPELIGEGETEFEPAERALNRDDSEPDIRVREYRPGDPVRWIHWKLSAKTDRLLVREGVPSGGSGLLLMLETALGGSAPDDMDAAASGLLSLSRELAVNACPHGVCWYDHGRRTLERMEVDAVEDAERARDALLQAASASQAESVCRLFRDVYPDAHPACVVLFSPHALTDVSPLRPESAVTLALPPDAPFSQAEPGVRVIRLPGSRAAEGGPA